MTYWYYYYSWGLRISNFLSFCVKFISVQSQKLYYIGKNNLCFNVNERLVNFWIMQNRVCFRFIFVKKKKFLKSLILRQNEQSLFNCEVLKLQKLFFSSSSFETSKVLDENLPLWRFAWKMFAVKIYWHILLLFF